MSIVHDVECLICGKVFTFEQVARPVFERLPAHNREDLSRTPCAGSGQTFRYLGQRKV